MCLLLVEQANERGDWSAPGHRPEGHTANSLAMSSTPVELRQARTSLLTIAGPLLLHAGRDVRGREGDFEALFLWRLEKSRYWALRARSCHSCQSCAAGRPREDRPDERQRTSLGTCGWSHGSLHPGPRRKDQLASNQASGLPAGKPRHTPC